MELMEDVAEKVADDEMLEKVEDRRLLLLLPPLREVLEEVSEPAIEDRRLLSADPTWLIQMIESK